MSTVQKITLQGLAFAGAMFAPQANGATVLHSETAASMVWKSDALLSSTSVTIYVPVAAPASAPIAALMISSAETVRGALDVLSLAALANKVFPQSRPMEDWEKQATDDFFLSHFD